MRYAESPAALAAAALALAGVLAGCGGDDSPAGGTATSASPTTATSSASPSMSVTPTPSATPSTTVVPAAGPLITMNGFTVNAPDGWQVVNGSNPDQNQAYLPSKPIGTLDLRSYEDLGDFGPAYALRQAKSASKTLLGHPATQAPDVTVDGVTMSVLTGSNAAYADYYEFIGVHEGYVADVTVFLNAKLDDPQGFVDAVVDTISFTTPPPAS